MSNTFMFQAPTLVDFGDGVRHRLGERLTAGRWGLLSSPSVLSHSGIGEVLDNCRRDGIAFVHLGHMSPNPRLSEVEEALRRAAECGDLSGIVAVGGGSVLDGGKLLRVALGAGATGAEVLSDMKSVLARGAARTVPLIAMPTTAGTGAEVSRGAIITDDATGAKMAARGEELVPDFALIDPELTRSLPSRRTAETGFDVIAHAVETFLSRASTSVTDIMARAALSEAPSALLAIMRDPDDAEARRTLTLHSWLMGYNLAHASTCLPHRLQYPVGSFTDTGHQIGLAALYPTWLRFVEEAAPERGAEVSRALCSALEEPADLRAHEAMEVFLDRIGIRVTLGDLGLTIEDVGRLTAAVTGRTDLDPIEPDGRMIQRIFEESFHV